MFVYLTFIVKIYQIQVWLMIFILLFCYLCYFLSLILILQFIYSGYLKLQKYYYLRDENIYSIYIYRHIYIYTYIYIYIYLYIYINYLYVCISFYVEGIWYVIYLSLKKCHRFRKWNICFISFTISNTWYPTCIFLI